MVHALHRLLAGITAHQDTDQEESSLPSHGPPKAPRFADVSHISEMWVKKRRLSEATPSTAGPSSISANLHGSEEVGKEAAVTEGAVEEGIA